jgi:hypothetical protein
MTVYLVNYSMKFYLSILLLLLSGICFSQEGYLRGTVSDDNGMEMSFVSVFEEETGLGTFTDSSGFYELKLSEGNHTVVFSYLGYTLQAKSVNIKNGVVFLDLALAKSTVELKNAEVVGDTRDRAREIMKKVRNARSSISDFTEDFSVASYQLINLESILARPSKGDTVIYNKRLDLGKTNDFPFADQILELTETIGTTYYKSGKGYKEEILATKTHKGGEIRDDIAREITLDGGGLEYGEEVITPVAKKEDVNPWVIIEGSDVYEVNFYKNYINLPSLTDKPILSPLANTSAITYKFDYLGTEIIDGVELYVIDVSPLNRFENSFSGTIWFEQETFKIDKLDLTIEGGNLHFAKTFNVKSEFINDTGNGSLIASQAIAYTIPSDRRDINGTVFSEFSDYKINSGLGDINFNREIKIFSPEAYNRDQKYWEINRTVKLDSMKLSYMLKSDSVVNYYESDDYLSRLDSAFNKINIWTPVLGYGRRNRDKGAEFYVEGIFSQIVPFGIGGYRHRLPGYYQKEFSNDFKLRTSGFLDYGFNNKDTKGEVTIALTYNPRKFVRTQVKFGDFYEMVNDFASLEQTFSRSNYIRTKTLGIAHRRELTNGLYAELSFDYQDQLPLDNLEFSEWSSELFGELNEPIDFKRYKKTELSLRMEYRIRQKYYFKRNKKMVIPSKFPVLTLNYRKGINGLFGSEVNFDFLELGAKQEIEVGRLGSTRWEVQLASFINQKDLRVLEYKFFRGSDEVFFSDPLRSFQLLGATLNTPNAYLRANVIHHFEGTILNKIPLIRRLKMGIAIGAGTLNIPDSKFYHAEAFGGVEKSFHLFKQLVRGGIYAVTSENTQESANFTYKVGLTIFEPFTRKWGY